jgi:hypothetical protein
VSGGGGDKLESESARLHKQTHTHRHTQTHTHIDTHKHTHTHTHIYNTVNLRHELRDFQRLTYASVRIRHEIYIRTRVVVTVCIAIMSHSMSYSVYSEFPVPTCLICMNTCKVCIQSCRRWDCLARICVPCVFQAWLQDELPKCPCGLTLQLPLSIKKLEKKIDFAVIRHFIVDSSHETCPVQGCTRTGFSNVHEYVKHILSVQHVPTFCTTCSVYHPVTFTCDKIANPTSVLQSCLEEDTTILFNIENIRTILGIRILVDGC